MADARGEDIYLKSKGAAALGARIRRLSDRIDAQAAEIYRSLNIQFEQRWFGCINQIRLNGPMTVTEIASALEITHASVSQTRRSLAQAGIVRSTPSEVDKRKSLISLTPKGQALVNRLSPLWEEMERVAIELDEEAGGMMSVVERMERALAEKSLLERMKRPAMD